MRSPTFATLAADVLDLGVASVGYFRGRGYRVVLEPNEVGYPFTPAFVCRRGPTRLVVEVDSRMRTDRLMLWVRYAKSCDHDIRVVLVIDVGAATVDGEAALRSQGVGLIAFERPAFAERIPPQDLSLNVVLPDLHSLPPRLRELLGDVYDQFGRTEWRAGFKSACQVLETQARKYLWKGLSSSPPRITILGKKGQPMKLSRAQVTSCTLGRLAAHFRSMKAPNYADSQIGQALLAINPDRVSATHHERRAKTERNLRNNVGRHMWRVIAALKLVEGVK
jgi:hypothetical protein